MEQKQSESTLPSAYMNLGFDADPTSEPSAPKLDESSVSQGASAESTPGPSYPPSYPPPKYEEEIGPYADPGVHTSIPSAPPAEVSTGPAVLKYNSPILLFEDIYEACIRYVDNHCCYSSRFAKQMKLTGIKNDCAFHYSLETFGEKRESEKRDVPYRAGDPVDGPSNGRPPEPWDMHVPLPILFKDAKTERRIPHSDEVVTCWRCDGDGEVTCSSCSGSGTCSCSSCGGSGRDSDDERCSSCGGSGSDTCSSCWGSGKVTCSRCDGSGKLKTYRVLIVTWKNHPSHFVSDIRKLPDKKFMKVTGDNLFTDERVKLSPILNAPDASVNSTSVLLLEAHDNSFPAEQIRKQRHSLRAIPFTIANYKWKDQEGEFYIYGKEKNVYFEDYPTSCCCICC